MMELSSPFLPSRVVLTCLFTPEFRDRSRVEAKLYIPLDSQPSLGAPAALSPSLEGECGDSRIYWKH